MTKVKILIPQVMSSATNGEKEFLIEGNTVKDIIKNLSEKYGESFKNKILDKNGNPKPVINIYINDENIKFLDELSTELNDKDEILFLPAVSGG
ncbi:MAG: molybdopterin synthase sulfur carrier subunit [Thaumarchaeota archaeon]|nr:molybdopterin synthase sulfur carrier subunit [Nitrososphaerota archaeon]|tara:strand:+ start:332 stop:613 length:282 start_codon:yes stop_codon:yes gene_type:complete